MQATERRPARVTGNLPGRSKIKKDSEPIINGSGAKSTKNLALPAIDIAEAKKFLNILDPDGPWNFQTFIEKGLKPKPGKEAKHYIYSSKEPETFDQAKSRLIKLNKQKACVSFCPNECDGKRSRDNVKRIRAFYVDCDTEAESHPFTSGPRFHLIVQTSEKSPTQRRFQGYILINEDCPIALFSKIQTALAEKFCPTGPDTHPANPAHPMRLPGFLHQKGNPFLVKIVEHNDDERLSVQDVIELYGLEILEDEPATPITREEANQALQRNQDGDADLFKKLHSENFCFDAAIQTWFVWRGHFWEEDVLRTSLKAIETIVPYYHRAAEDKQRQIDAGMAKEDPDKEEVKRLRRQKESIMNRISVLHSRRRKEDILCLAAIGEGSFGVQAQWDDMQWQLPCLNGVVDLSTGKLRPGKQSDFVRTVVPLEYDPEAKCTQWDEFIASIHTDKNLQPDPEVAGFVQRLFGYAITGTGNEDIMPILHGPHGQNGKTTMFGVVQEVTGPFCGTIEKATIIQSRFQSGGGAARQDLFELQHKRINCISELGVNDRIDTELFKKLTGGDRLNARGNYATKSSEFIPRGVMFMLTNNRPTVPIRGDDSSWTRLRVVVPYYLHFTSNVTEDFHRQIDSGLKEKLLEEKQGVLNWLIKGAMDYLSKGLQVPDSVVSEGKKYKQDQDAVGRFLAEFCAYSIDQEGYIKKSLLYDVFERWILEEDGTSMKKKVFTENLPKFIKDNLGRKDGYPIYKKIDWKQEAMDYVKGVQDAIQDKKSLRSE